MADVSVSSYANNPDPTGYGFTDDQLAGKLLV